MDINNLQRTPSYSYRVDSDRIKQRLQQAAQEKKAAEEKAAKKRAEKKAEKEKAAERRTEKNAARKAQIERLAEGEKEGEFSVTATGTDIKAVTKNLVSSLSGISVPAGAGFDIKA